MKSECTLFVPMERAKQMWPSEMPSCQIVEGGIIVNAKTVALAAQELMHLISEQSEDECAQLRSQVATLTRERDEARAAFDTANNHLKTRTAEHDVARTQAEQAMAQVVKMRAFVLKWKRVFRMSGATASVEQCEELLADTSAQPLLDELKALREGLDIAINRIGIDQGIFADYSNIHALKGDSEGDRKSALNKMHSDHCAVALSRIDALRAALPDSETKGAL